MATVKLAIIYYSATGANHQMAQWAAEGGRAAGADVKVLRIPETAPAQAIESNPAWKAFVEANKNEPQVSLDDLEWADAIIFSIPTRYGNMASQAQAFIDTTGGLWFQGKLANKVVSAMSSAQNIHGGQESTILSIYKTMYHWGAIVVSPAYTDQVTFASGGNPYGMSTQVDGEGKIQDDIKNGVVYQAKRTVNVAEWLLNGKQG